MEPFLEEANQRIEEALAHVQRELSSIRAGRANPSLIEEIPVNVYDSRMKLNEVGTISSPQPSLLLVSIWDASIVKDVEKAILEANIGLTPSIDGQNIRLPIPPLTKERREEYIKLVYQKGEQARIEIRQIRQEERSKWDKEKDAGTYGEDELERREKLLQVLIEKISTQIEELVKAKEAQLKEL